MGDTFPIELQMLASSMVIRVITPRQSDGIQEIVKDDDLRIGSP